MENNKTISTYLWIGSIFMFILLIITIILLYSQSIKLNQANENIIASCTLNNEQIDLINKIGGKLGTCYNTTIPKLNLIDCERWKV